LCVKTARPKGVRAGEDIRISSASSTVLVGRQHIMTQPAQLLDGRKGKILIGVELHPRSLLSFLFALFVLPDRAIDLLRVSRRVSPRSLEVGGRQGRIIAKQGSPQTRPSVDS
jgi:hypothetical protein